LAPVHKLDLHKIYRLRVIGTPPEGITDTAGEYLDGTGTGQPGTDYVTKLTAADLVLNSQIAGDPARLARLRRSVARIEAHERAAFRLPSSVRPFGSRSMTSTVGIAGERRVQYPR
jgi:hypothetical protein